MFANNKNIISIVVAGLFLGSLFYLGSRSNSSKITDNPIVQTTATQEVPIKSAAENDNSIKVSQNFTLNESGSMEESDNADWWLNSGGLVYFENSAPAKTIHGDLDESNKWHQAYRKNNSRDTDKGKHPQNIFRLVNLNQFKNLEQETYFRIIRDNLSQSRYRNQSNGLLHFNRYQDGDNLYYTGIRVDGFAVIKKKSKGKYYTLAYNRIFEGKYDRKKNPNLLPQNTWLGLRSVIADGDNGKVNIKVFLDRNKSGEWELVAEATDDGKKYGGQAILSAGHAGIRTDFMDVEFDDYRITKDG